MTELPLIGETVSALGTHLMSLSDKFSHCRTGGTLRCNTWIDAEVCVSAAASISQVRQLTRAAIYSINEPVHGWEGL